MSATARCFPPPDARTHVLNDVHSRLNATRVDVVRPLTIVQAQAVVRSRRSHGTSIAVMGARHAMGGQQFLSGGTVLNTSALDRVVGFDPDRGEVTVEAGIRWPALMAWLGPVVAGALLLIGYRFWRFGLTRYSGTGS